LRDANGAFIAAAYNYIEHVVDAPTADVHTLREGLLQAQHIGCSCIIIQSDYLEVVETMKQGGFSATAGAPIYDKCKILWYDFSLISIKHCNRDINRVAHNVASLAI
jgi:hypothetical protein